jgi:hypothetical protein
MDVQRLYQLAFGALALVSGCSDDPTNRLVTVLVGSVLVILLVASCGFSFFTAMLVGGAINVRLNLGAPTAKSKRWGWVLGAINLAHGVIGVWLIVQLATKPSEDPPEADVYFLIGAGTLAALALGVTGLVAAARARPGRVVYGAPDEPSG